MEKSITFDNSSNINVLEVCIVFCFIFFTKT
jgi:hypothetical protein